MNVSIRKFTEVDINQKICWINNPQNNKYLHYNLPLNYADTKSWFIKANSNDQRYDGIIECNGVAIGLIGLLNINLSQKKAELYILIGESSFKGLGIAKQALKQFSSYAFSKYELEEIYIVVEVGNIPSQKLFESIGFTRISLLKDNVYNRGKLVDQYLYRFKKEMVIIDDNPVVIQKLRNKINRNDVYMLREDLLPYSFGGNKLRKSLYFFDEILANNHDVVVTYGSSSSNHVRIIANLAASHNIKCIIISPKENYKTNQNSSLLESLNVDLVLTSLQSVKSVINEKLMELSSAGFKPYFVPGGGHGIKGTEAYVNVYSKILEYEENTGIQFDYIVHASGTGTTQAGLICGNEMAEKSKKIIGISIARTYEYGAEIVLNSVNEYLLENKFAPININQIIFSDLYLSGGYGISNEEIDETIRNIFNQEGIPLDSTYTGKAFWGFKKYIVDNEIYRKRILFIHSGGTPLFFN